MTMKLGIIPSVAKNAPNTLLMRYGYNIPHGVSQRPGIALAFSPAHAQSLKF
jgi:hypothetical protein